MYNNDSDSLNAGAPDITITGNQNPNTQMASMEPSQESTLEEIYADLISQGFSPREAAEKAKELYNSMGDMSMAPQQNSGIMAAGPGTYTQNRKQMMAYGGIAGLDGRKKYGIGSWIQKNVMDPIKHATIGEEATKALSEARVAREDALYGKNYTPGYEQIFDIFRTDENKKGDSNFDFSSLINNPLGNIFGPTSKDPGTGFMLGAGDFGLGNISLDPYLRHVTKEEMKPVAATEGKYVQAGPPGSDSYQVYVPGRDAIPGSPEESRRAVNPLYPIAAGLGVGKYVSGLPKDKLPMDTTSIDPAAIATAARGTDAQGAAAGLRFLPEQVTRAAQGGRIGYRNGIGPNQGSPGIMSQAITDTEVEDAFGMTVDQERAITDQQVEDAFGISVDDVAPVDKEELKDLFRRLTEPREMAKYKNLLGKIGEEEAATPLSDQSKFQNLMLLVQMFKAQGMNDNDALEAAQAHFGAEGFGRAEGGRIGYKDGTKKRKGIMQMLSSLEDRFPELMMYGSMAAGSVLPFLKEGGRVPAQEGGLMNLGGMEKDYRNDGGFVPIGGKEKADDVPARLSKNEFVFTADAVRGAGGGDIDKGAEIMENLMKSLESGGEVSEDSQGLEGARDMFANAQQLQKRII